MSEEKLVLANEVKNLFYKQMISWIKAQRLKSTEMSETQLIRYFERALADAQHVRLPTRAQANWVVDDADTGEPGAYAAFLSVHCSKCKWDYSVESGQYEWNWGDPFPMNFCPNCGAEMSKENTAWEVEGP